FVGVHPMRMRVVDAEEFEPPAAKFRRQPREFLWRNFVIPDWIRGGVLCRERLRDNPALPCQNSAAFPMGLAAGVLQQLPVHFAAASHGWLHCAIIYRG